MRADDPATIVRVSAEPVLDIGRGGCFDDNGMILGDVVDGPGGLHMFYVGFQRVAKAKFLAFTGLAISTDGGDHFRRMQETPILDRAPGRSTIGAVHSAIHEDGRWRLWYAVGDDWEIIGGQPFPRYHIRYAETDDLRCHAARRQGLPAAPRQRVPDRPAARLPARRQVRHVFHAGQSRRRIFPRRGVQRRWHPVGTSR